MEADILLSVLPPANALSFAEQTAFALKSARTKPVFVDCNAVSPATVRHIHAVISATGADFVDAGIIGYPPKDDYSPRIYCCGEPAQKVTALSAYGLDMRLLDGPIGAASALKMAFAGISKGHIAIISAMILAADRAGSGEALRQELLESETSMMKTMAWRVPQALPKAWRWVAEMQEIAEFAREDQPAKDMWMAISAFFARMADDLASDQKESETLRNFFKDPDHR
jgi:3-hydroxyisobutyrate dehydrogenase-like beta-hydroxyacid dehydrogenase